MTGDETTGTRLAPMEFDRSKPVSVVSVAEPDTESDRTEGRAAEVGAAATTRSGHPVRLFLIALVLFLFAAAVFDALTLLGRAFAASAVAGTVLSLLLGVVIVALLVVLLREWSGLRRLATVDALRSRAGELRQSTGTGAAAAWLRQLSSFYDSTPAFQPRFKRLQTVVADSHSDAETISLAERFVLAPSDEQAYAAVVSAARDTALITALSPSSALDLVVVAWRNTRLVRTVAQSYGAQPGMAGTVRLIRRMIAYLAVAGIAETAHGAAVDALGGSLAAAVSARIGQGVLNGLLTARLGLAAMHICRPVPFSDETKPNLGRIRLEVLKVPQELV